MAKTLRNNSVPSALDILQSTGSVWNKDNQGRVEMALACHDANDLPRVKDAGELKVVDGVPVQITHSGLLVKQNGYQGDWMTDIIKGLKGVHEPQEEKVFSEVLKRVKSGGAMIELGSWWSYYSMWFLQAVKSPRKVICCEPDPENLTLGEFNMQLNNFTVGKDAIFYNAAGGSEDKKKISFATEDGTQIKTVIRTVDGIVKEQKIRQLEILHIDIQGAELQALEGALQSIRKGIVRFVFISTHHYVISNDPNIHNKCLKFIEDNNGTIIAQHTVLESSTGDGLIVASFKPVDKDFRVAVSRQPANDSLFRSAEEDVDILWQEYDRLASRTQEFATKLEAQQEHIDQLENVLNQITPLPRHVKKAIRHKLKRVTRKTAHKGTTS
ncbi:MAG TPA: FkbM family methyltransferase [Candidatus Saccharimonadales bacterium]